MCLLVKASIVKKTQTENEEKVYTEIKCMQYFFSFLVLKGRLTSHQTKSHAKTTV